MLARSQNRAAVSGSCFDLCCRQAQLVRVSIQFACSRRVLHDYPINRVRSSCSQQARPTKSSRDLFASPKAKRAVKSTMANGILKLPRNLPRPTPKSIESEGLRKDFSELNGVPNSFVREMVHSMADSMINGVTESRPQVEVHATENPTELLVKFNDNGSLPFMTPTHILDLSNSSQPSGIRRVFLIHQLPFAANCSSFPSLPASETATPAGNKSSSATLPVIRAAVPSVETFDLLQIYLYKKDTGALRRSLLGEKWSELSTSTQGILERAVAIKGFWSNACALGTFDNDAMYNVIDECWSEVLRALEKSTSR